VGNSPVDLRDPSGLDVWIEGPSGDEPPFHQSINVGDPNGQYSATRNSKFKIQNSFRGYD